MIKPAKPVLRLVPRTHNREPFEWENIYQVRKILQDEILRCMKSGMSASAIASKCNLSPGTVSRLGYGDTKEPRASTALVLLRYFGYKVMVS